MTSPHLAHPVDAAQRIAVAVELLPGPLIEALAERVLQLVVEELRNLGAEITGVSVELQGRLTSW